MAVKNTTIFVNAIILATEFRSDRFFLWHCIPTWRWPN